jgi:hypothetical protein
MKRRDPSGKGPVTLLATSLAYHNRDHEGHAA